MSEQHSVRQLRAQTAYSLVDDKRAKIRGMLLFSPPELLFSAIDFSLGNLSGLDQRCDARVRQFVSMLAHAIL